MNYRDMRCPNCDRVRVELSGICEKCNWDVDAGDYATITRPEEPIENPIFDGLKSPPTP